MQISDRLKEARKNHGLTQEEVAEKVLVSRVTVSNWETGRSLPDIASLITLSDLYGITLDELVKGDSRMTEKVKKDAEDLKVRTKIIIATAIIALIFGIAFTVCGILGGAAEDFADAAAPWLFMGLGFAGIISYLSAGEKTRDVSEKDE